MLVQQLLTLRKAIEDGTTECKHANHSEAWDWMRAMISSKLIGEAYLEF
jgi:hypothetical protein